jgi:hypothetical protein
MHQAYCRPIHLAYFDNKSNLPLLLLSEPNKPYADTGQKLPYKAYDAATDNAKNPLYKGIAPWTGLEGSGCSQ